MPILVVFGEPVTVFSPSVESTLPPSILHPPWGAKTIARSGHYHFHLPHQWVVKTTILKQMNRKVRIAGKTNRPTRGCSRRDKNKARGVTNHSSWTHGCLEAVLDSSTGMQYATHDSGPISDLIRLLDY